MTDPIADFLTRLRNAIMAHHRVVEVPASNLKKEITKILFEKGYILNYKFIEDGPQPFVQVPFFLEYADKPGRVHSGFLAEIAVAGERVVLFAFGKPVLQELAVL